jgi:hypothetical protein
MKKGRGKAQKTVALLAECYDILEDIQPTTVRGVCYQLFTKGFIPNMGKNETSKISKLLTAARETGHIPWEWLVDETREAETINSWTDPAAYSEAVLRSYRKDFWQYQPERLEVWSEKGTIRGVLAPILNQYAVTFRVFHGYGSATSVHDVAVQNSDQSLTVLYCGDWDPSGLNMSEVDLPERLSRYGGNVELIRIALTESDTRTGGLPSFPAESKTNDPRHKWFIQNYGESCWELDALPANRLRARLEGHIASHIDMDAWEHCKITENAERESIASLMKMWPGAN